VISYQTCTGPTVTGSTTSSCSISCATGTKIVGAMCANNTSAAQFNQGTITDPGTNTSWSCLVKNQNATTAAIAAVATITCLPQ